MRHDYCNFPYWLLRRLFSTFKVIKKNAATSAFFLALWLCTCESGFLICFLPCHLAWHDMEISHCRLLLHLWILHCLFTSELVSGTAFYRQWEHLPVKSIPIYIYASIKKSTLAMLFTMIRADTQQITYCYSCRHILSSGLPLALECFTSTQPLISSTASTFFVNRQMFSKMFSFSQFLSAMLIVEIMMW